MKWSKDYSVTQDPSTHTYVVRDKMGKVLLRVPGITSRINEYFGAYQNDFPKSGVRYLDDLSIEEIKRAMNKRPTPIPGSRISAGAGSALQYKTEMSATQLNSYLAQREAIEAGTVVHEELQEAILKGTTPTHPKAKQLWANFSRKYPSSRYIYETEVPVTDMKKWGTSIDVIVTDKITGEVSILDWKTGREHAPEHRAQLTKEAQMYELMTGKKVSSLGVVYSGKIQTHPFMETAEINKIFRKGTKFKKEANVFQASDRPYNIQLAEKYLKQLRIKRLPQGADLRGYSDEVTFLDTETGHANQILQIGAVKGRINFRTGMFEYTDTFERYYYPLHTNTRNFREAQRVHHINADVQRQYRKLQAAQYAGVYDDTEKQALMDFIGESAVAGHAIMQSDLPWLGLDKIKNNIYDTYEASRFVYKNEVSYGLENLYNKHIGKRKEMHQAFIDALMNAQFGGIMSRKSVRLRWLLTHPGFATYPQDLALEGVGRDPLLGRSGVRTTTMGSQIQDYFQGVDMGEDDVDEYEDSDLEYDMKKTLGMGLDINSVANMAGGSGWSELFNAMSEAVTHMDSYAKTVNEMAHTLNDSIAGYNLTTNRRMMSTIAHKYAENDWDAALSDELGVPSTAIAKYHNRLSGMLDRENRFKRQQAEDDVTKAVDKGLISQSQADTIMKAADSVDDLNDALQRQIKNNENLRNSLMSMRLYDLNQLHQTAHSEWAGIKGAANGVIPSWFAKPIGRFGDAAMNMFNRQAAIYNAGKNLVKEVGHPLAMGLGGVVGGAVTAGNPMGIAWGIAAGKAIASSITQIWGNTKQAKLALGGERIQEVLNLTGGILDMVMVPLKLLGSILKTVIRLFGALAGAIVAGIKSMQGLSTPLTHLTGVHFPMQQGLEAAGHLTGLGKDAYGNAYNDFANQAQALYATGQMNRDRLVAASMLGVFGDVYNPTADADEMYGGAVNKILSQLQGASPERRKQIMMLAGRVDSTLPQTLQVMSDLKINDWKKMRTYGGYAYFRPHSDSERTLYRRQSFQLQGNLESMMNSIRRIASRLWELGGKQFMDFLNHLLDGLSVALGKLDKPREAIKLFKDTLSAGWKALKDALGLGNLQTTLKNALKGIVPIVIDVIDLIGQTMIRLWSKIIDGVIKKGGLFLDFLNTIRIVRDKDSPLGFRLAIGAQDNFQGPIAKLHKLNFGRDVQIKDASGKVYSNSLEGAANIAQWTDALRKMNGQWAEFDVGGQKLRLTNTNASEDAYRRWMSLYKEYYTGGIKERQLYSMLYNDKELMNLFGYESKASIAGLYEQYRGAIPTPGADNEAAALAGWAALMNTSRNVLDVNIAINDKEMWSVQATEAGIQLISSTDRKDIGGFEVNATTRYLQQAGQRRAAGGN